MNPFVLAIERGPSSVKDRRYEMLSLEKGVQLYRVI
jgi:hypothetical protein